MIVIACYAASRLLTSRRSQRETEADADGVHVAMGVAMAGMLVPRLSLPPARVWEVVFGVAAAWFGWQALRMRRGKAAGGWRCVFPVPHLVESVAMLYMLLMAPGSRPGGPGPMPGMGGSSGAAVSFPALALVLAFFMLGYVVWTADQLTSLVRARTAAPTRSAARDRSRILVTSGGALTVASPQAVADARGTSGAEGTSDENPAGRAMLAPRLAVCYKIAMAITMGYMLIMML
jgi:hypothetical protein